MSFSVKQSPLLRESRRPRVWTVRFGTAVAGTREDAAKGLVAEGSLGGAAVRNDFDRIPIFRRPVFNATWDRIEGRWNNLVPRGAEGFSWSPTEPYREVIYRCQPFWYKLDMSGDYAPLAISVSDRPIIGFTLAPMFKNGHDFVYRPCFEMGLGEDGLPHSRAGLTPYRSSLKNLMSKAREYDLRARTESVLDWFSDSLLILVELATWRVHTLINGHTGTAVVATGEALPLVAASLGATVQGAPMVWRGKENPWKNTASALCDILIKKVTGESGNSMEICYLPDITRFDGTLNEHYCARGTYVMTASGVKDVGGFAMGQGFFYPSKAYATGTSLKSTSYAGTSFATTTPMVVAVGGSSTAAMIPTTMYPSMLNWEAVDVDKWPADTLGARLILDEGRA